MTLKDQILGALKSGFGLTPKGAALLSGRMEIECASELLKLERSGQIRRRKDNWFYLPGARKEVNQEWREEEKAKERLRLRMAGGNQ